MKPLTSLHGETGALSLHLSENAVSVGHSDGNLALWNVETQKLTESSKTHDNGIISILETSGLLLTHGREGVIHSWDVRGPLRKPQWSLPSTIGSFCGAVLQGQSLLAPAAEDNGVSMWDIRALRSPTLNYSAMESEQSKRGLPMSLGFVPRASTADFVVGFEAGVVDLVDSIGGGLKSSVTVSSTAAVTSLSVDPRGQKMVIGTSGEALDWVKFRAEEAKEMEGGNYRMEVVGRERLVAEGVGALKLRPDCRILLVGNWSGGVELFRWKKWERLGKYQAHDSAIQAACFPEHKTLLCDRGIVATADKAGTTKLWQLYPRQRDRTSGEAVASKRLNPLVQ